MNDLAAASDAKPHVISVCRRPATLSSANELSFGTWNRTDLDEALLHKTPKCSKERWDLRRLGRSDLLADVGKRFDIISNRIKDQIVESWSSHLGAA